LIVKDDGPGRVSDERGTTDTAGARLGLQLCRALVSRAGGSLIADLDREQGSTVRINLRLARDRGGTPPQRQL
jgi:K+-sensing histidine kinase KdpD